MKITIHKCADSIKLDTVPEGEVVQLCGAVHNKHESDDYFIVNEVCGTYKPKSFASQRKYNGDAIPVTNLRTGSLAYLDPDREIIAIDCALTLC